MLKIMNKTSGKTRLKPSPENKLLISPAINQGLKIIRTIKTASNPNNIPNEAVISWLKKFIRSNASGVRAYVVEAVVMKSIIIFC